MGKIVHVHLLAYILGERIFNGVIVLKELRSCREKLLRAGGESRWSGYFPISTTCSCLSPGSSSALLVHFHHLPFIPLSPLNLLPGNSLGPTCVSGLEMLVDLGLQETWDLHVHKDIEG